MARAPIVVVMFAVFGAACAKPSPALPPGARVVDGLPVLIAVADDGSAAAAETRGRRGAAGDFREQLWLARAPFEGEPESLGLDATLPSFSAEGRAVAWLASKERGDRSGPGMARATSGGHVVALGRTATPLVVGSAAVLSLDGYAAEAGNGTLFETWLASGARRLLARDVPPGGFSRLADGSVIAVRRPVVGDCSLVRIPPAGSASLLSAPLDCDPGRGGFRLDRARASLLVRHPRAGAAPSLARISGGVETTVAGAAVADAFDADGRAWWVEPRGASLLVRHDARSAGDAEDVGTVEGAFPRAIFPAGERGAWLLLADRECVRDPHLAARPACMRLVAVGDAAPPPGFDVVRRVVTAPGGGFPLAVFAGLSSPPILAAVRAPGAPMIPLGAYALDAAVSPDGRKVAAAILLEDGAAIVVADFAGGEARTVAHGAPRAQVFWGGHTLFYTWTTCKLWDPFELYDPRNGLYAVDAP